MHGIRSADPIVDRPQARQLEELLAGIGECVVHVDAHWRVRYCSPAYLEGLGLPASEVIGRTPFEYQAHFEESVFHRVLQACRRDRQPRIGIGFSKVVRRWLMVRAFPLGEGMVALANDADEHTVGQFELAREALRDPLTGIGNKRALLAGLEERLAQRQRGALVLIGLRRFNAINDTLGHGLGDLALMDVVSRMQAATVEGEALFRLTGVEFVLLTPADDEARLRERVGMIASRIGQPILMRDQVFVLGSHAGGVLFPSHGDAAPLLLRRAALALRQAKRASASMALFDDELEAAGRLRAELELDFRAVLCGTSSATAGRLSLALQPKGRLRDRAVIGAEALIRWQHPLRGALMPGSFLPIAQECQLMVELDRWVIDEVMRLQRLLLDGGHRLPISINLSVESLSDLLLVENVQAAIERHGVPPELLEIEIPENALMRDVEVSTRVLAALSALGVRLSIDDFGTGYSSFAYLARFPVHTLKIDRSFVHDMVSQASSRTIVHSLVRLSHALQLQVVAEGAESDEEMDMLRRMQCDAVQGYGYGMPQPFALFLDFIRGRCGCADTRGGTLPPHGRAC
ncbi:putative bifunctional diguanylate cyclase/phosphodiesterase [Sphaerotilus uruguayifluvii]|uniref:Diguanylate cyclase (GGDEF)-like protein n=1 Tax=Sphaerotilus uruguayifluvii TaxID=2735897 RepID=A0ABX2G4A9_9BURK|nr:diguanylate cyclase (GGDEF)-like protein [Leptothrix sp. C29]